MVQRIVPVALVAACLVAAPHETSRADENFRWRVDYFNTIGNIPAIAYYETEREAVLYKQTLEKARNSLTGGPACTNIQITKERKPARPPAGTPSDPLGRESNPPDARPRSPAAGDGGAMRDLAALGADWLGLAGDRGFSLFEYRGQNDEAYKRAKVARDRMLKGEAELVRRISTDVNDTVTGFNQMLAATAVSTSPVAPPAADPPAAAGAEGPDLGGTSWGEGNDIFGLRFLELGAAGDVTGRFNVEGHAHRGRWRATGPNSIEGDFGDFGSFTATLVGGQLHVRWGNGRGALTKAVVLPRR